MYTIRGIPLFCVYFSLVSASSAQWYVDNQAATAGESYARGMSDVIRSAGDANLRNSQAAINYETARSQELDNRLKYTNTYFQQREQNRAYRAAERGPRPSSEQLFRLAKEAAPERLSASELDPLTGNIGWPPALKDSAFDGPRSELETLFAQRASNQGFTSASSYSQVSQLTDQMMADLKQNIRSYPSSVYLAARNFLTSLSYESQLPPS